MSGQERLRAGPGRFRAGYTWLQLDGCGYPRDWEVGGPEPQIAKNDRTAD